MFAAGFRGGDLIHNCFSYHLTPAGSMVETGAHALGCTVFPGGTGQTELQVQAIADLGATGYVGTPSFLKIILDKADEQGVALPSLTKALVSGEAFPGACATRCRRAASRGTRRTRRRISAASPTRAKRAKGSSWTRASWSRSCGRARAIRWRPATWARWWSPTLVNTDYPLIRFGTGDLSALLPGASPCGRTNMRIKGWMGRADQTTKVKGMFVHPSQVAAIVKRHPEIAKARLVVDNREGSDRMTLLVEVAGNASSSTDAIVASIRDVTKLRGEVAFRLPGELPNDGKVIDDVRKFD